MDNNEIWRPVKGFEGLYEVSSLGRVRSIVSKGRILTLADKWGYMMVTLSRSGTHYYRKVHQLVAEVFVEVPDGLKHLIGVRTERGYPMLVVNHKDRNKANNVPSNLEWCTQKYNVNCHGAPKERGRLFERRIAQYTKGGEFVAEYKSLNDAARAVGLKCTANISANAHGKPHYKSAGGYVWRYVEEK